MMNWRNAMQMGMQQPQQPPMGSMFPTRGPGGGWQMPSFMQAPKPPVMQPQAPPPPAQMPGIGTIPAHVNANLYPGYSLDFWTRQPPQRTEGWM